MERDRGALLKIQRVHALGFHITRVDAARFCNGHRKILETSQTYLDAFRNAFYLNNIFLFSHERTLNDSLRLNVHLLHVKVTYLLAANVCEEA